MGPQNRKHTAEMSRFRVMRQKEDSKKRPKSQITPEKNFWGTSEWYQSIGLKILHNMSASKNLSRMLKRESKIYRYGNFFNMSWRDDSLN